MHNTIKLGKNRQKILRKIIGVMLIISILGISPGTSEFFNFSTNPVMASEKVRTNANPFTNSPFNIKIQGDTDAQKIKAAIATGEDADKIEKNKSIKKKMSSFEDIGWLVARSLLPTVAVMAFSAAVAAPLALIIAGAVVIGAATAGLVTLGYELRKNHYRAKDKKQGMDKILRTVSIMAAINGAMAPFQLATAGLVSVVGPATIRSVAIAGVKTFAVQAASKAVIYGAKGVVMNAWYDHYYNYDEKEKYLKHRIQIFQSIKHLTNAQSQELANTIEELDRITKEKYTFKNFKKDMKKGLIWAGVSGVLGGATARVAGDTKWAKIASSKIFGTPDKAGMVANAVVSNPFAFATGAGMDLVEKKAIIKEISLTRKIQSDYKKGSPVWEYYENKINGLQKKHDSINLVNSGTRMAISNAAVQVAMVGTTAATTRWGAYTAQRKKIQSEYEDGSTKWVNAHETRIKLEQLKNTYPKRANFKSYRQYKSAYNAHKIQVKLYQKQYQAQKVEAAAEQKLPLNRARYNEIAAKIKRENALASRQILAKAIGRDEYLKFKMHELKNKSENQQLSQEQLREKASSEIIAEYKQSAKNAANELTSMTNSLRGKTSSSKGKIEVDTDGKKYIVVRDKNGVELLRKSYSGATETWWQTIFKTNRKALQNQAIKKAVKATYTKGACVKPSVFRDTYLEMRISQLKARGLDNSQIDKLMPSLTKEANAEMVGVFGGSWSNVVKSEFIAQGLARAKYEDGKAPKISDIGTFLNSNLQTSIYGGVGRNLRGQLSGASFVGGSKSVATQFTENYGNQLNDLPGNFSSNGNNTSDAINNWLAGIDNQPIPIH